MADIQNSIIEAQRSVQLGKIDNLLDVIKNGLAWADKYGKDTFPSESLREYRRELKKIRKAVSEKCSAAAYGESQVGKSYLMGSLMSSKEKPLYVENCGRMYSFVMELNPSGGNNRKEESTGVITRFTVTRRNPRMKDFVKVGLFSVADIVNVLVDGYYKDIKHRPETIYSSQEIDNKLKAIAELSSSATTPVQTFITRDDVRDICDYIHDFLGDKCKHIVSSQFAKTVSNHIHLISPERWVDVFGILWNNDPDMSRLFSLILSEYRKIGFRSDVYVPFRAVMWRNGTILKIDWIDVILGKNVDHDEPEFEETIEVLDDNGNVLAPAFSKAVLSTIAAELVLVIPEDLATGDRKFLREMDFLDFPGARARKEFKDDEISGVLPTILRRGKVAYLFNSYTSNLRLSSILFCYHNDQAEAPIGGPITDWIDRNIADTKEKREKFLQGTQGISPLFLIATKFNCDLQISDKDVPGELTNHWVRFDKTINKIIEPAKWYEQWTPGAAFRHIYPLRDFKWSRKHNLFEGTDPGNEDSEEKDYKRPARFTNYFEVLRDDFVDNPVVKQHFANPAQAWSEFATVGNDGSRPILRDLNIISAHLTGVRHDKFGARIDEIQEELLGKLTPHYIPEDDAQKNKRLRKIIRELRMRSSKEIGAHPEYFGYMINKLMIPGEQIRRVAFDLIVLKTEVPEPSGPIDTLKIQALIKPSDSRQEVIDKLCEYLMCDEDELPELIEDEYEVTLDAILNNDIRLDTTVPDLVAHRVLDTWGQFLDERSKEISKYVPHTDEIVFMYQTLAAKFDIKNIIAEKIREYEKVFSEADMPIAVADFASLLLNNFVSSVGIGYMNGSVLDAVRQKLDACGITKVSFPEPQMPREVGRKTLVDTLDALDSANDFTQFTEEVLRLLPFWNAFTAWQNNIAIGLVLSSDVVSVDEGANKAIKSLIDKLN